MHKRYLASGATLLVALAVQSEARAGALSTGSYKCLLVAQRVKEFHETATGGARNRFGRPRKDSSALRKPSGVAGESTDGANKAPVGTRKPADRSTGEITGSPKSSKRSARSSRRSSKASSVSLKTGISHSEILPPMPPGLRTGAFYQSWSISNRHRRFRSRGPLRFKIPKWIAGRWQRTESTETMRVKLPSGDKVKAAGKTVAKSVDVFGTYEDESGQIWQVFDPKRAAGEIDRGDVIDHHMVTDYKIEIAGPKTVVVEVTASHLVVSKSKQRIVQSYQDEELNTYTLIKPGLAKTDSSVKVFDQMGKPTLLTRSISRVNKIESLPED